MSDEVVASTRDAPYDYLVCGDLYTYRVSWADSLCPSDDAYDCHHYGYLLGRPVIPILSAYIESVPTHLLLAV